MVNLQLILNLLNMKHIYNLFFLSLFFVTFISCQNEISQITEPAQGEALKVNANVTNLVQRTVTKDGSKDNIIDNASCLQVQLPITVTANGLEINVDSEADFEVIEAVFDEFDDDSDHLEISFPIEIILSDYTKITINTHDELEALIEDCGSENEMDDDIECLDFVYPINFSMYNSENQLTETVKVENDEQFYNFVSDIDDSDIVVINFPISVILYDGSERNIENMDLLENVIEEVKDMCNEDDNNDYNDDDCNDCSQDQITQLLKTCSWIVDRLEINGVEQTEQYTNYTLFFMGEGVVKAINNGNEIFGTWKVDLSDNGILLKINFESLADFSFNWRLYEIEDDNEVDLRIEDNRFKLEKHCN